MILRSTRASVVIAALALLNVGATGPAAAEPSAPPVRAVTLGSINSARVIAGPTTGAYFYGQAYSPAPVVAWFEFQVDCGLPVDHPRPVHETRHQEFGSAHGGRRVTGHARGLPVAQVSCYRFVAEPSGSTRPVYGEWRQQPNFGPHGGQPPIRPPKPHDR
jgi:hypothetical protein